MGRTLLNWFREGPMTKYTQYSAPTMAAFWRMPVCYFLLCCFVNTLTGALDYPAVNDMRSQREFNAAIGMPLLTCFFWSSLRIQQQQMASAIMSYLLDRNALSQFALHRGCLASRLRQQIMTSATLAILMTVLYIISADLVAFNMSVRMLVLDLIAVCFWFFLLLFLLQMVSSTQYMTKHFVCEYVTTAGELKALKRVSFFSLENMLFGVTALIVMPVFWFNTDVAIIDLSMLTVISLFLVIYLLKPAYSVYRLIRQNKQQVIDELTAGLGAIHPHAIPVKIECERRQAIEREIEEVEHISPFPMTMGHSKRVIRVMMLIATSWMSLFYLEHLVRG